MEKKYNVESFNLDHNAVTAPYVRLAATYTGPNGDIVTKFDIRFTQPNKAFLPTGAMHTIEHLVAEYIRDEVSGVIDFSPMGCRTGFYFTLFGNKTEEEVSAHFKAVFQKLLDWPDTEKLPGYDPKECGNYLDHNLAEAKTYTQKWLEGIEKYGFSCYK